MSLQERIKSSRKLRKKFPSRAFCKSCNTPNIGNNFKYIFFSQSSLYGPVCLECFNDEDVPFSKIIEYYTNRGTYEHEGFSEKEIEYIISDLVKETKVNYIFKNKYLRESRFLKFNKLFENEI